MRLMKPILAAALISADVTMAAAAADKAAAPVYPKAKTVEQVDDYFGTKVSDPYRWMENIDSADVKSWVDAENELTQSYLAKTPGREKMHARLMELVTVEKNMVRQSTSACGLVSPLNWMDSSCVATRFP